MFDTIKKPFLWVRDKCSQLRSCWNSFEDWIAGWLPGLKTKFIAALGGLGSAAFVMQGFVTGIPTEKLVGPTGALIVTSILFALVYFFHGLTDRVEARS